MTLHIFNPEHDIALAANLENFTPPHAGRQLRHDLGFLPALWATDSDAVMVDDCELAAQRYLKFRQNVSRSLGPGYTLKKPHFYSPKAAIPAMQVEAVDPWGWDLALRGRLKKLGVSQALLPDNCQIDTQRQLSHRRSAATILPLLQRPGATVGEAFECHSLAEVETLMAKYPRVVLKAPWSSSGRGLRFASQALDTCQKGWLKNLLAAQGSVMLEPFYNKTRDFGMEFSCLPDGTVVYQGLSLFHTANGAYAGNILATEAAKRNMMAAYLPLALIDETSAALCHHLAKLIGGRYCGPLGVDMMVVNSKLHPCVEINLRRTMGHVALALTPRDDELQRVMRIVYADNNYQLKIQRL